ncbi:unnamed protein product [Notodromas monacha]|uniref:Uncharacterized protein n=1 Tax=Notodromas monacha TaxID=399045 RepID=A0A7R9GDQ5_9CRUS|nr:unnamed protein product [Notodromas monacha]CAG0917206.1 unnamed protein product [Notodromas monacha]
MEKAVVVCVALFCVLFAFVNADDAETAVKEPGPQATTSITTTSEASKTTRRSARASTRQKPNFAHQASHHQTARQMAPADESQLADQQATTPGDADPNTATVTTTKAGPVVPPGKEVTSKKPIKIPNATTTEGNSSNNGTTSTDGTSASSGQRVEVSDSDVTLQNQIYILSGVFGALGLIQFLVLISLAVALSSVNAKLRQLQLDMKPSFGTLNRGYMQPEMEMSGLGNPGLDELEARYQQQSPIGNRGDFNGFGSSPSMGMPGSRPPGFPRAHWVGDRVSRNYT